MLRYIPEVGNRENISHLGEGHCRERISGTQATGIMTMKWALRPLRAIS